jgi:stage II sporulation protein D
MTLPNTDKPLPTPSPGGARDPEDGGQKGPPNADLRVWEPKTEDRGPISEPIKPLPPSEVCPPASEIRSLPSGFRRLFSIVRRLPGLLWLGCGTTAVLCVIGAIVLLRGCEGRVTTRPTPQMSVESRFWVRVLLLHNVTECTIEVPSAFRLTPAEPTPDHQTDEPTLEPLLEPTKISLVGGQLMLGTTPLAGKEVVLSPEQSCIFGLKDLKYRGWLKLVVGREGQSFDAINLVPLEPYLAGVVGEEMPDYWEPEALRAQAIAARTYCLYTKNHFGTNRSYDVSRTQSSQVYGGVRKESSQVWAAVNSTCGQVLMAPELMEDGKGIADCGLRIADSTRGLFPAYYSSSCGGHTTSSEEVFGDSFGPLRSVPCPYCKQVAKLDLFYWPMATFDRGTATKQLLDRYPKLEALGEITDITATEESCYGDYSRLRRIRLTGATGKTDTLRAEDLRLALDPSGRKIKSAICRIVPWGNGWAFISGRGWGHGVGMCQCGAEGMARLGSDAQDILRHYYPGAPIVNLY